MFFAITHQPPKPPLPNGGWIFAVGEKTGGYDAAMRHIVLRTIIPPTSSAAPPRPPPFRQGRQNLYPTYDRTRKGGNTPNS